MMHNIGDKIVYPLHGAGVIEAIEEKEVLGEYGKYYILRMSYDDLKVMFPIEGVAANSVRDVIPEGEADNVISYFKAFYEEISNNWNRRYRENMQKIKSGNIYDVAQVVKMLMLRDKVRGLSAGERKMFVNAKQILISELVLSKSSTQENIEHELAEIVDKLIEEKALKKLTAADKNV